MILAGGFDSSVIAILAGVVLLLACSALLALAETGLVRMSKARARSLAEHHVRGARTLLRLVEDPESFLAPVLLLVLVCQLVAATLVGVVSAHLFGALGVVVATLFEVVVIFVFAEAVPKQWAVRYADRAALLAAPIVSTVIRFPPIRVVASLLVGISRLVLPDDEGSEEPDVTESELLAMADVAVEAEVIEQEERVLLSAIIEFGDTIVREVMAPRPDIVAVPAGANVAEAVERAIEEGKSRLPVYEHSVDDVVGVAYTLDLIEALRREGESTPVTAVVRPAHYVPETKRVALLLREMQAQKFQLAIVVDEYGQTAGIVTLEDLVEELVGEIADELDEKEEGLISLEPGVWRVPGKAAIDEVAEVIGAPLPEGDWDTLAGLLLYRFGRVPREGESLELAGCRFTVERVARRRIRAVRIAVQAPEEELAR